MPEPMPESMPAWLVTVTVLLGTVTVSLNNTALNPAIPDFMQVFDSTAVLASWIISGFMISMGMTMPVTGYLSQKFGKRSVYLFALALFMGCSMAGALATSLVEIIAVRIGQGIAAGLMIPLSLGLIFAVYPPDQRGKVTGIWATAVMLAPAVGPVVGGVLIEFYDWPALFMMNIPLALLAFISGFYCLPTAKEQTPSAFDWRGFALVTVGIGLLMLGLNQLSIELLLLALICLGFFIRVELGHSTPLLSIRIFAIRNYWLSVVISVVLFISMFQSFVVFPILMRTVLGYGPVWTGAALLITALFTSLFANVSGKILDAQGPRAIVVFGLILSAVATLLLGNISETTSIWIIFSLMAFRGIGFGFAYITVTTAGLNAIPEYLVTQGSAMNNIARRVFTSGAIILITLYFDSRTTQLLKLSTADGSSTALNHLTTINEIFVATGGLMLLAVPFALLLPKPAQYAQKELTQ